jgi:hypothetical protein
MKLGPPERDGQVARFFLCPSRSSTGRALVRPVTVSSPYGNAFERSAEGVVVVVLMVLMEVGG